MRIIALNKADLVDEETLEFGELEIRNSWKGPILKMHAIVPVSSINNTGLDKLLEEINRFNSCFKGKRKNGPVSDVHRSDF